MTGIGGLSLLAGLLVISSVTGSAGPVDAAVVGRRRCATVPLSRCAAAHPGRRLHQVGAVPVPFLAAQRHGGADAGLGLSAFGDDGEGRRLSADAAQSGARRDRRMGDAAAGVRRHDPAGRRAARGPADRPQADARLHDGRLARAAGDADRLRHRNWRSRRRCSISSRTALFKGALFMVAGAHRPRNGHARHQAARRPVAPMPITFAAGLLAALSMGGIPLFLGFVAKEEIYAALQSAAPGRSC